MCIPPTASRYTDILKYYGCELGALTTFDTKSGTSIVNGAHDSKMLIDKLEGFIKKYVQCYQCGNPETVFKVCNDPCKDQSASCGVVHLKYTSHHGADSQRYDQDEV